MTDKRHSEKNIKWQVSPEVLSSRIEEEVVLMSLEAGFYFSLDPVGSRIWELLEKQPATINELVDKLIDEYDVDRQMCLNDVRSFIDTMISKRLVVSVSE